jgi:hypothetical protein
MAPSFAARVAAGAVATASGDEHDHNEDDQHEGD